MAGTYFSYHDATSDKAQTPISGSLPDNEHVIVETTLKRVFSTNYYRERADQTTNEPFNELLIESYASTVQHTRDTTLH